jgi:hypothetical protein
MATVKTPPATGTSISVWNAVMAINGLLVRRPQVAEQNDASDLRISASVRSNQDGLSRCPQVFVRVARQVGEIGYLHDIPTSGAEELSALAVDEKVGLAPGEDDPRDRGDEDEFSATDRP